MNCAELHRKWLDESITIPEIESYADCTLEFLDKYDDGNLLIEDVYDYMALQEIILASPKYILKMQIDNMENWFTALMMAVDDERYELCAKIKRITEIYETLLISAIYKFRKELFTDKFIEDIILINQRNNKIITDDI